MVDRALRRRRRAQLGLKGRDLELDYFCLTPDHDRLCVREQLVFLNAIGYDVDLGDHVDGPINSLRIVLDADQASRTGGTVAF